MQHNNEDNVKRYGTDMDHSSYIPEILGIVIMVSIITFLMWSSS